VEITVTARFTHPRPGRAQNSRTSRPPPIRASTTTSAVVLRTIWLSSVPCRRRRQRRCPCAGLTAGQQSVQRAQAGLIGCDEIARHRIGRVGIDRY
jgi:hypothetical protein